MTLWPEDTRLARLYDIECAGRDDHNLYHGLLQERDAKTIVDIGCGTGVFAVDAASRDSARQVIGVDPATAVLDIARNRPGGDLVTWVHGTAGDLVEPATADAVVMMGHVAQYFVSDPDWRGVLADSRRILRPGGWLMFEVRNPERGWAQRWTKEKTHTVYPHPDGGEFQSWVESVDTQGPADSFAETHEGHTILPDGNHLVSTETLRFRSPDEITRSLETAGFVVRSTFGDWDRAPFTFDSDELIIEAQQP